YDILLKVADCVRDLGYDVPDAPSRQTFVDELVSYPIPSWHPYDPVYCLSTEPWPGNRVSGSWILWRSSSSAWRWCFASVCSLRLPCPVRRECGSRCRQG